MSQLEPDFFVLNMWFNQLTSKAPNYLDRTSRFLNMFGNKIELEYDSCKAWKIAFKRKSKELVELFLDFHLNFKQKSVPLLQDCIEEACDFCDPTPEIIELISLYFD